MRIYHVASPTPKHVENSVRGIRYAKRHGYDGIDLDLLITRDDVIVGCHWPKPMIHDGFRDPLHRIDRDRPVKDLPWEKVSRLVAGRWPRRYHIDRIERLLKVCADEGIVAVLEPKSDDRFMENEPWVEIRKVADAKGAHIRVRSLRDSGEGRERIEAAERNGIQPLGDGLI